MTNVHEEKKRVLEQVVIARLRKENSRIPVLEKALSDIRHEAHMADMKMATMRNAWIIQRATEGLAK
jgi:hypothetical protein